MGLGGEEVKTTLLGQDRMGRARSEELGEAAVFCGQRTTRIGDEFLDEVDIAIGHPERQMERQGIV